MIELLLLLLCFLCRSFEVQERTSSLLSNEHQRSNGYVRGCMYPSDSCGHIVDPIKELHVTIMFVPLETSFLFLIRSWDSYGTQKRASTPSKFLNCQCIHNVPIFLARGACQSVSLWQLNLSNPPWWPLVEFFLSMWHVTSCYVMAWLTSWVYSDVN